MSTDSDLDRFYSLVFWRRLLSLCCINSFNKYWISNWIKLWTFVSIYFFSSLSWVPGPNFDTWSLVGGWVRVLLTHYQAIFRYQQSVQSTLILTLSRESIRSYRLRVQSTRLLAPYQLRYQLLPVTTRLLPMLLSNQLQIKGSHDLLLGFDSLARAAQRNPFTLQITIYYKKIWLRNSQMEGIHRERYVEMGGEFPWSL